MPGEHYVSTDRMQTGEEAVAQWNELYGKKEEEEMTEEAEPELQPLPCPLCGKVPKIIGEDAGWYEGDRKGHISEEDEKYISEGGLLDEDGGVLEYPPYWYVFCMDEQDCGISHLITTHYVLHRTRESAVGAWNDQVKAWSKEKKEEEE